MIRFISSEEKEKTGMLWKKGAIKTLSAVMLVSPMVALVPTAVQAMPITGAVPTTGNGTYNSPYIITTPQELYYMNTLRTGYYKLGANIDLSNYEWSPISSFAGMLDGAGHYIKNLNINQYNADAGLFSTLATGGVVRNLGILYANIAIPSAGQVNIRAGIIAGTNQGTIQNSHVSGRVNITGIVTSNYFTFAMDGGLVGLNAPGGMIANTLAQVDVAQAGSSPYDYGKVGGLAGRNDGSISNSYFVGTVKDEVTNSWDYYNPGGSVGYGNGSISATFWDSTVSGQIGNNYVDGIPRTTTQMKSQQNYSGWDFTNVWSIQEGVTYPFLRNYQPTVQAIPDKAINIADGSYSIDLTSSFTDPAGDPLTITAVSSNTTVLTAQVSGNQLLLTPVAQGTVTVTAKAVNSQGAIVTDSFVVTVASAGLVTGMVQGPGNTPISGASVSIGGISDVTDAQGQFTLSNIPPGSQTVTVSSAGYNDGLATVTVTAGQSVSAGTITLTPVQTTGSVTGGVYGPGNTPISGASVSIGGISDTTDAQGQFTLSNIPPGSQTVTVSSVGYNHGTATVTVTVGQSVSAGTITLTPVQTTGSVTGGVYGPGNTPISGASVSIGGISDVTDAQGQFTLSNIPPGSQTVTVSSAGYNDGLATVTVTAGQSVSVGTISLTAVTVTPPTTPPTPTPTPTTPPTTPPTSTPPTPTPTTPPTPTPTTPSTPTTPPTTPIPTPTPTTPSTPTTPPTTPIPTPTPTTPPTTPTPAPAPAGANVFNSGIVDTTKLISFLENKVEIASQSSAPLQFSDAKGHWAEQTITAFVKLGAIQGNGSGDFVPNGNITRTEFAIILARVFNIQTGTAVTSPSFTDITGHWGSDAILKLAQAGVVKGYADSTFHPDQSISREEMVVILTRILNLDSISKDSTKGGFTDLSNSFAGKEIEVAAQVGMINGKSIGKFDPKSSTTRAEALTTLMNALSLDPQVKNLLDSLK